LRRKSHRALRARQHRVADALTEDAPDTERVLNQQVHIQSGAARIDAPSAFDRDGAGRDARPRGARLVAIGERGIATAEISVALPWRCIRDTFSHADR